MELITIQPTVQTIGGETAAVTVPSFWSVEGGAEGRERYRLITLAHSSVREEQAYAQQARERKKEAGIGWGPIWYPQGLPGIWVANAVETHLVIGMRLYDSGALRFEYHHSYSIRGMISIASGLLGIVTLGASLLEEETVFCRTFSAVLLQLLQQLGLRPGAVSEAPGRRRSVAA